MKASCHKVYDENNIVVARCYIIHRYEMIYINGMYRLIENIAEIRWYNSEMKLHDYNNEPAVTEFDKNCAVVKRLYYHNGYLKKEILGNIRDSL